VWFNAIVDATMIDYVQQNKTSICLLHPVPKLDGPLCREEQPLKNSWQAPDGC
jgi:hypothetical protein